MAMTVNADVRDVDHGEDVLYFPVKIAIARLGGVKAAAERLGVPRSRVQGWNSQRRDPGPHRAALASWAGISRRSFDRYFDRLEEYRLNQLRAFAGLPTTWRLAA